MFVGPTSKMWELLTLNFVFWTKSNSEWYFSPRQNNLMWPKWNWTSLRCTLMNSYPMTRFAHRVFPGSYRWSERSKANACALDCLPQNLLDFHGVRSRQIPIGRVLNRPHRVLSFQADIMERSLFARLHQYSIKYMLFLRPTVYGRRSDVWQRRSNKKWNKRKL